MIHQPRTRSELDALLLPLHLDSLLVEAVLRNGAAESRNWTNAAPMSAPEHTRWYRSVETFHLESAGRALGWEHRNPQNLPLFFQAASKTGLVISSGDENTGVVAFRPPATRNSKGTRFLDTIVPAAQGSFFDVTTDSGQMIELSDMWVLLYNERQGAVYCELSRPAGVEKDRIVAWSDRILMPPFEVNTSAFQLDEDGNGDEFAFTITRR